MANIQDIVKVYLKIRDTREKAKREFEELDKKRKADMERLETELLRQLDDAGADSIRTPLGTVYKQIDVIPQGADWEAIYEFIKEKDAFDLLEKRLKKTTVKEYMEANEGKLPPGINVFQKYDVHVRRGNN